MSENPQRPPRRMTYAICSLCSGNGFMRVGEKIKPCICKPLRVLPTGITLEQIDHLFEINLGGKHGSSR